MAKIRIGKAGFAASSYLEQPHRYDRALARARREEGHALCECVVPPRRMVIREVRGHYYLAIWPLDGQQHAPSCPFYRDEPLEGEDGEADLALQADETGFRFDPSIQAPQSQERMASPRPEVVETEASADAAVAGPSEPHSGSVAAPEPLGGLLRHLWRRASLNRWMPGWQRDWWRVRLAVLRAAHEGAYGEAPLSEVLHVVSPWRASRGTQLRAEWEDFTGSMRTAESRRLLLAEATAIQRSTFSWKLSLAHTAQEVFIPVDEAQALGRDLAHLVTDLPRREALRLRVVLLMEVRVSRGGYLLCERAGILLCSQHYVPVAGLQELSLINRLVDEERAFLKPIGAITSQGALPAAVLYDAGYPGGLYLDVASSDGAGGLARQRAREAQWLASGHAVSLWPRRDAEIPLPPLVGDERSTS